MNQASILTLSDQELEELFGEEVDYLSLKSNAEKYKTELVLLLEAKQGAQLKPLIKKLSNLESRLHKGKIWEAFGDTKGARYQYERIQKGEESYDTAQYHLFSIELEENLKNPEALKNAATYLTNIENDFSLYHKGCSLLAEIYAWKGMRQESLQWNLKINLEYSLDPENVEKRISLLSEKLDQVSLEEGKMKFVKGKEYTLVHLYLDTIHTIRDVGSCGSSDSDNTYVIALSHNENGHQYKKLSFLCTSYADIDNESFVGTYVEMNELDELIHPETVIFQGVNEGGELVFKYNQNQNYKISLGEAQDSVRTQGDEEYTGEEEKNVLVWETGDNEVIVVSEPSID